MMKLVGKRTWSIFTALFSHLTFAFHVVVLVAACCEARKPLSGDTTKETRKESRIWAHSVKMWDNKWPIRAAAYLQTSNSIVFTDSKDRLVRLSLDSGSSSLATKASIVPGVFSMKATDDGRFFAGVTSEGDVAIWNASLKLRKLHSKIQSDIGNAYVQSVLAISQGGEVCYSKGSLRSILCITLQGIAKKVYTGKGTIYDLAVNGSGDILIFTESTKKNTGALRALFRKTGVTKTLLSDESWDRLFRVMHSKSLNVLTVVSVPAFPTGVFVYNPFARPIVRRFKVDGLPRAALSRDGTLLATIGFYTKVYQTGSMNAIKVIHDSYDTILFCGNRLLVGIKERRVHFHSLKMP
jgi:hypothetical protein